MIPFEEFTRCPNCGNAEFEIKKTSLISKVLPKGQKNLIQLESKERHYCTSCNRELTHYDF